jgi:hypothetical protein
MTWWTQIDRDPQLFAIRRVLSEGGCLVIQGDVRSGREVMAVIAEEFCEEFGYPVVRASAFGGPPGLKTVLRSVWQQLAGPVRADETPPWIARAAALTPAGIVEEVARLARSQERSVLILEAVDAPGPLPEHQIPLFEHLGQALAWPVIVISHAESGTRWSRHLAQDRICPLTDFSLEDIRRCVMRAPECAERSPAEIEQRLGLIAAGAAPASVRPTEAYALLQDWTQ